MKKISLVFFGSGPVAAKALALLAENFDVEAVITKPKPPRHKGDFPVLELAKSLGVRTLTVQTKEELTELFSQRPTKSKLGVVIDYGIIITQKVIDYFPLGIINSHFSLLPEWRGADPITFSILSGQRQTGVSLMLINSRLDEGPLLAQAAYNLPSDITTPILTQNLIELSNEMLREVVPLYYENHLLPIPQEGAPLPEDKIPSYSRKLTKQDGFLDFTKPSEQLEREIRAFIDWPKSRTRFGDIDIIITRAHAVPTNDSEKKPGDIEVMKDVGVLMIECGKGYLCIDKLKPAGKKEMSIEEFIRGYGLKIGNQVNKFRQSGPGAVEAVDL
jgi:methionyl-tRNA formyltransferase